MRFFSRPDIRDQRIKHMEQTIETCFKAVKVSNMGYLRGLGDALLLRNLNDQLKAENERLRETLKTIREESHDTGACELAADALADATIGKGIDG